MPPKKKKGKGKGKKKKKDGKMNKKTAAELRKESIKKKT